MNRPQWEDRYVTGDLPWDSGRPDQYLVDIVTARPITPGRALEVGCGTGTNAIWLAQQGFEVTALDLSATAVLSAQAKADSADVTVSFGAADFLHDPLPEGSFDFAFDRGCFHTFDEPEERRLFALRLAAMVAPNGLWLSLIGSTDGPPRDHGPPRRSARDIAEAVEEDFELLELGSVIFDSKLPTPARAWRCLMRRRSEPAQPSTRRGA